MYSELLSSTFCDPGSINPPGQLLVYLFYFLWLRICILVCSECAIDLGSVSPRMETPAQSMYYHHYTPSAQSHEDLMCLVGLAYTL